MSELAGRSEQPDFKNACIIDERIEEKPSVIVEDVDVRSLLRSSKGPLVVGFRMLA
jgi:hypothetical protein